MMKIKKEDNLKVKLKIVLIALFLVTGAIRAEAKIYGYTLLEKTRKAELILLGKCIEIHDQKDGLKSSMGEEFKGSRLAFYKIIEIWKGKYDKDTIDFKFTEPTQLRYIKDGCFVSHRVDEKAILFLNNDFTIFAGCQGKIQVEEKAIFLYQDAIMKFLKLDTLVGKEKIEAIIRMIDDDNSRIRESMLRELHEIDNTTYGIEIANLLKHKDVSVRQSAISALEGTKDKRVVPFVIAALKDLDPEVRRQAPNVLWRIDDERIIPALMEAFNDESAAVRRNVIFALYQQNSKEAIPLYLKALKDSDPLVRQYGAVAFQNVEDPGAVPELLNALKDENPGVREAAVETLDSYIRFNTVQPDNEIIKFVTALLTDKDSRIKDAVCGFIITAGEKGYKNEKIINKLLQIAETDNEVGEVRERAIVALGAIGLSEESSSILLKFFSNSKWQIRAAAARGLCGVGRRLGVDVSPETALNLGTISPYSEKMPIFVPNAMIKAARIHSELIKNMLPQLKKILEKEENQETKKQLAEAIRVWGIWERFRKIP